MSTQPPVQPAHGGPVIWSGAGIVLVAAILSTACASATKRGFIDDDGTSSGGSSGFEPSGFDTDGGAPPGDGCSDAAKLVYVVSSDSDLYSFAPETTTFTKVGRLECPTTGLATPNSMAIDRQGTAWINYSDGSLFKVSTADASCSGTSFAPNQAGFLKFGMAFSADASGSTEETLYISGLDFLAGTGQGFGKIDLATMTVTMLGDYTGNLTGEGAELTGTGDGRLFGFFTTRPSATLAEIAKTSGATSDNRFLEGVSTGSAWAFSFWGGDFWFYTSEGVSPSRVTRLRTSGDGQIAEVRADVGGFRIVGAGVSTCAPTTPTK